MPKVMEIIEKETKGKSYHTYKYSYDSIGLPSIDYDDDPNKVMKWKDSGETDSPKGAVDLKHLADQLQQLGERPLLKYFLDGSRHVFKVDDIAYNKQVFPVVAGQIGVGCCRRENKRMQKERFFPNIVLFRSVRAVYKTSGGHRPPLARYPYTISCITISFARFRMPFIFRTHAIGSSAFKASVTPSVSAYCSTSRRKSSWACSSMSARCPSSTPAVSRL